MSDYWTECGTQRLEYTSHVKTYEHQVPGGMLVMTVVTDERNAASGSSVCVTFVADGNAPGSPYR